MVHETTLIATIVASFALAFVGGFLANYLRLPSLVGYLVAGIAIGPFTPGFVADGAIARQLAEIGVVLLMFGVGLHFSIRDLLAVRTIVLPGAIAQIAVTTAIGAGTARLWGWSLAAGLVLGLALSVASTVVLLRELEERRALDTVNGRIAVGWLVVEDLAMVLTLVMLPTLSGPMNKGLDAFAADTSTQGLPLVIGLTIGKVVLFVTLVLVIGKRFVPWLLTQVARTGSRELFMLGVLTVALGIAFGSAALFDVSFALGAFFAGVVLSESDLSHQAAADVLPLRDAFAVLFFVSIGMLFDPSILMREPGALIALLLIVVAGKSLAAFAIVLIFGYPLMTALTVSASLAQIGEFSFILAGLGVDFGLLPPEGRGLIIAGALLSITINQFIFSGAELLHGWFQRRRFLLAWLGGRNSLTFLPNGTDKIRDHAILVGYGRVGSLIGEALARSALPYVVVERDLELVERLRARGLTVVYGDALTPGVLEGAHVERARLLVVAAPGGFQGGEMVRRARHVNLDIDTLARSHSDEETAFLHDSGAGITLMGERELALSMMGHALQTMGVDEDKAQRTVQDFRSMYSPSASISTQSVRQSG